MGQIEDELRKLIIERYGSLKGFADKTGIPYTTLASIFQRGISNAKVTNITKITEELNIDTNELVSGKIAPAYPAEPLTKEQEEILEKYGSYPPLETLAAHFDGDEYTDEELKEIRRFAKYIKSLRQIERNNLDKYGNN